MTRPPDSSNEETITGKTDSDEVFSSLAESPSEPVADGSAGAAGGMA